MKQFNFNKAKYINLVLENCEEIKINFKDVVFINCEDITPSYHFEDGEYTQIRIINDFEILLKQSANKTYLPFGMKDKTIKKTKVFNRIQKYHDIVALEFLDKNSKQLEYFWVIYKEPKGEEETLGAPNVLQNVEHVKIDKNSEDMLYISIKKRK